LGSPENKFGMNISLRDIDAENFHQCLKLKVANGQENFVADNAVSIAQSKISPHLVPLVVYSENEMVGFAMCGRDPETENFWLVRLMIGAEYQGKGYGKSATQAVIEKLNKEFDCREVYLSFVPENLKAEKLYSSLDFKRTGETDESGEVIMRFKSTDNRQPTIDN